MKVLVVDDSATIRERLVERLSALQGVEWVDTASNARAALRAIEAAPPDVVVLDIHMPGISGMKVLEALRAHERRIVTIVLTNDPAPHWREACVRAGADFFLDKSADWQHAIDVIARLALSRSAPHDRLPSCWKCYEPLPIPAWLFDVETLAFEAVNDAAVERYGYSRDEFLAMTLADIRLPDAMPRLMEEIAERRAGATIRQLGTWQHRSKDGSVVHVGIAVMPLDGDGRRLDLVLAHDISERIAAEAALKASENRLRQAQKMEAIGRLAGGIAHDFNNLLTLILGISQEMIERLSPDDPMLADARHIFSAGEAAAKLTNQLLAFSRQHILAPKIIDLNAVIGHMAPMLLRLIREDIALAIRTGAEPCAVHADPGQIEQVILNLVVNARDAMPHGGTLTIESGIVALDAKDVADRSWLQPGQYVQLLVSDSGQGMDAHTKAHLFEPFFTTKAVGGGTGLGLPTVYSIVKQSHGYIQVESELGEGTRFRLFFPVAEGRIDAVRAPAATPRPLDGTESVLLVEDDRSVRQFTARVLTARGYDLLAASSPEEAQRFCERSGKDLDLLLTDVVMPGMTGRALADVLRTRYPAIKVIYMSGYTTEAIGEQGALDPRASFIGKPFTASVLASKVREVLDGV